MLRVSTRTTGRTWLIRPGEPASINTMGTPRTGNGKKKRCHWQPERPMRDAAPQVSIGVTARGTGAERRTGETDAEKESCVPCTRECRNHGRGRRLRRPRAVDEGHLQLRTQQPVSYTHLRAHETRHDL